MDIVKSYVLLRTGEYAFYLFYSLLFQKISYNYVKSKKKSTCPSNYKVFLKRWISLKNKNNISFLFFRIFSLNFFSFLLFFLWESFSCNTDKIPNLNLKYIMYTIRIPAVAYGSKRKLCDFGFLLLSFYFSYTWVSVLFLNSLYIVCMGREKVVKIEHWEYKDHKLPQKKKWKRNNKRKQKCGKGKL